MYLFLFNFSPASLNTAHNTDINNCIGEFWFIMLHHGTWITATSWLKWKDFCCIQNTGKYKCILFLLVKNNHKVMKRS